MASSIQFMFGLRTAARTASAALAHDAFSWDRIARCDGSPQVWEVGVRLDEGKTRYFFLMTGSRAGTMDALSSENRRATPRTSKPAQ